MDDHTPRTISIIGHRHPDTDSVCAAISYARLKEQLEPEFAFQPCRAGILNRETEFVLQYFGVSSPRMFLDVSPQMRDVDYRKMAGVDAEMSMRKAWETMRDLQVDTLCVVDEEGKLNGLITIRDMTTANMDVIDDLVLAKARTSYQNVIDTLDAAVLVGPAEGRVVEGHIITGAGSAELIEKAITPGDVVIVSNRIESQLSAIEMGAGCLVVCAGSKVSDTICMLARERGCLILSTPHNTYVTGQMIPQSVPIRYYMVSKNLLTFTPDALAETATKIMATVRYRYFPIVDEDGKYLGMVSRRNMLNLRRRALILVDHNEKSQAVDGIDSAEVLEIIDHHRISGMETESPVYFRNVPVGCTCTIVYQMYHENGIDIDPPIAGLMLSAILSDTLMFRSPTCTSVDERAARDLAKLAGVELEAYAEQMFEAGSDITGKTPDEILNSDFKIFGRDRIRFGIAQNNFMTGKSRRASRERVAPYLRGFMEKHGLDYLFCMFTDVPSSTTEVLITGKGGDEIIEKAFDVQVTDGSASLPGIVSRKKQFVPAVLRALQQLPN